MNNTKNRIRLTVPQLHNIIKESVKRILNEDVEEWYAVWVAPNWANEVSGGYAEELVLVKAANKEQAEWEAEERLVRKNGNTTDFHGYAHLATKEDFARYKTGNRWRWIKEEQDESLF